MSDSLENAAQDAKLNLKKYIKEGKTSCCSLATTINQIIDRALWEYMPNLPGDSAADKLHNLIALPYDLGGLNTPIHEVDALLAVSSATQRKFRTIVHQAKPGERTDLKAKQDKGEDKVDAEFSPAKSKGKGKGKASPKSGKPSSSQLARDRAADRAAKAIPKLNELMEEGLLAKNVAAKIGQQVKNPDNPTPQDKKTIENQKAVKAKLEQIVPEKLPEDPKQRKHLASKIKQAIEQASGLESKTKISLSKDPQATAKLIAAAIKDLDYLQQLIVALELEAEELASNSKPSKTIPLKPAAQAA